MNSPSLFPENTIHANQSSQPKMTDALTLLDLLADNFKEIRGHLDVFARVHLQRVCTRLQAEDPGPLLSPFWRTAWEKVKGYPQHLDLWCALLEARLETRLEPTNILFQWARLGVAACVQLQWMYLAKLPHVPCDPLDFKNEVLDLSIVTDKKQWRHAVAMKKPTLRWAREFDGPAEADFIPAGLLDIVDDREAQLFTRMDSSKRRPRSSPEHRFLWKFRTWNVTVEGWDALTVLPEHDLIGVSDALKWTRQTSESPVQTCFSGYYG
jgi:hypothetical protein